MKSSTLEHPSSWLSPRLRLLAACEMLMMLSIMCVKVSFLWWIAKNGGAKDLAIWAITVAVGTGVGLAWLSPTADRYSKAVLLTAGLAALALHALTLGFLADAGQYSLRFVVALSLVEATALAIILPSSFSLVPELVAPSALTKALSLQKGAKTCGNFLGPLLAAIILGQAAVSTALWTSAALFLVASSLALMVRNTTSRTHQTSVRKSWRRDVFNGMQAKWEIAMERRWTSVSFFIIMFLMPSIGMMLPLKVQALEASASWLGICEASLAGGMLLGALGGSFRMAGLLGRFRASFSSVILQGVSVVLLGVSSTPMMCIPPLVLLGFSMATVDLIGQTHRMLAIPPHFRGRMSSANLIIAQIAMSLGPVLASGSLGFVSVHMLYIGFGAALLIVGVGYLSIPGYVAFLNMPHDEAKDLYARRHPHLFNAER